MAGERLRNVLKAYREMYRGAGRAEKTEVLDKFCRVTEYCRKYATALLNQPVDMPAAVKKRRRGVSYSARALRVITAIWEAAGYPWSVRLKALIPLWLPWASEHVTKVTPELEEEILEISARQLDRRLKFKKRALKRRIYGRTKPGTLLKHHIPLKTDHWDVTEPGFVEIDLVSHSGENASGEFVYSLNVTDIHTGWVETRALMGRGETGVVNALDEIRRDLPFVLHGIDSDNGSEFINFHLYGWCEKRKIQFTRGRPYKKDDNAHIEQKNWTHVRRVFGWDRYDSRKVMQAMNDLYIHELRLMMNLYQPSVKLLHKDRVGSRLRRRYYTAQTPLDRLVADAIPESLPSRLRKLLALRERLDPFTLAERIETKLDRVEAIRRAPTAQSLTTVLSQQDASPRGGRVHKETTYAFHQTFSR